MWNHAYAENYDADSIPDIRANAKDAYVLLDPNKDGLNNPASVVRALKQNGNQVSAYFSVGTGENWRDDFAQLKPYLVTKKWDEWDGEFFVSEINDTVRNIMKTRIDKMANWGFDWIEFDNMDWVFDDDYRAEYDIKATITEGIALPNTL